MKTVHNEIRTGLLVLITTVALAGVLIYLAAPGVLRKMEYRPVYFDDAGGIQLGAPVMLAGRRVGQVVRIDSPVPEGQRPKPNLEAIVLVEVRPEAKLYADAKAIMLQYSLLGEQVVNFSGGTEAAGMATPQTPFIGERQLGLNDTGPKLIAILDPVAKTAEQTMKEVSETARQLTALTSNTGDLTAALEQMRMTGENLAALTGSDGALQQAIGNVQLLTGSDSQLAQTLENANRFTGNLANNRDLNASLSTFRRASQNFNQAASGLRGTVRRIAPQIKATVHNAQQFTDTVKHQPWRLIWPTTKKYPEDQPKSANPAAIAEKQRCP